MLCPRIAFDSSEQGPQPMRWDHSSPDCQTTEGHGFSPLRLVLLLTEPAANTGEGARAAQGRASAPGFGEQMHPRGTLPPGQSGTTAGSHKGSFPPPWKSCVFIVCHPKLLCCPCPRRGLPPAPTSAIPQGCKPWQMRSEKRGIT